MRIKDEFYDDITFCDDKNCPNTDCRRHPTNIPCGIVSMSNFGAYTEDYDKCEWRLNG